MKKMFYSDVLDKYFEEERECRKAELQYQLDKQAKEREANKKAEEARLAEEKKKEETALASKEKKALSDAIEDAETKLVSAQNDYHIACESYREKVSKLKKEYLDAIKEAEDTIIRPAADAVKAANQAKYKSVKDFNDKFGTYTVKYTGDKAYKEMQKTIDYINSIFDNFWF